MLQTATVTCPRCLGWGVPIPEMLVRIDGGPQGIPEVPDDGNWCQQCDGAGLICEHCGDTISGIPDHECQP